MKYNLQSDLDFSTADQRLLDKKMNRIGKLLEPPYTIDLRFKRDTHHATGNVVTCTINIKQGKKVHHAERSGENPQNALDQVLQAMRQELKKHHDKRIKASRVIKGFFGRR